MQQQLHLTSQDSNEVCLPIIIPAYQPDRRMLELLKQLSEERLFEPLIVVDDGSSPATAGLFVEVEQMPKVVLLRHSANRGKGAALKSAMRYCLENLPQCVGGAVTADCDGQHRLEDIKAVAKALLQHPTCLVLGVRDFNLDNVPARSRLGNKISCITFRLAGVRVSDTQTGLRGIPHHMMEGLLAIEYNRYEFETSMLITAARGKTLFHEVPIETVYLDDNRSSHFSPLRDSWRIYRALLSNVVAQMGRFIVTAVASAALDLALFTLLFYWLLPAIRVPRLIGASVIARLVSACCNYLLNRYYVFRCCTCWYGTTLGKYATLCIIMVSASYATLRLLIPLLPGVPAPVLKAGVELLLFIISFVSQKYLIFYRSKKDYE